MWRNITSYAWAIRRTWGLVKAYWPPCSEDWSGLASIMLYEMGQIRDGLRRNQIIENADKYADRIDATMVALKHLLESDSFDYAEKDCPNHDKEWADRVNYYEQKWLDEFVNGMKYIQHWWD